MKDLTEKKSRYDIFISYRREGGAPYARILQLMLAQRGYSVFLDYDELRDGFFNDKIKSAIKSAPVFLIVLSENALDRCENEDDWVRQELECAINNDRKIIPVNPDGKFNGIHTKIPENIASTITGLQHSYIYFGQALGVTVDQMIRERIEPEIGVRESKANRDETYDAAKIRLEKQDRHNRFVRRLLWTASSILVAGVLVGILFIWRYYADRKDRDERLQHLTELRTRIERGHGELKPVLRTDLDEQRLLTIDSLLMKMRVLVPDSLWISQTEFTRGEWADIMGEPCNPEDRGLPVAGKSFMEIMELLKDSLSDMTGLDFDLPSAEEWKYAAKGGKYLSKMKYSGSNDPDSVAWYSKNSSGKVHLTGNSGKIPNYLDLIDMSGNVGELCNSPYTSKDGKEYWIVCGGDYKSSAEDITVDSESNIGLDETSDRVGFRAVIRNY